MTSEYFFIYYRIQMGMTCFLTNELLNEIGINAIGDVMAILHHAKPPEAGVSLYNTYIQFNINKST